MIFDFEASEKKINDFQYLMLRWWHRIRGKEDPYLKIGDTNDRSTKGNSDYEWALQDINFEIAPSDFG
ncbi:hypothetical protein [Flavobacterium sp. TSSA_36]|uniref:hypothetical protein n=1 Tax=Flavobacterium sp. TSSA_36 TaxID=3447669 RepID=UPI003F2B2A39